MNSTELHEAYLGIYDNYLIEGKKKQIKKTAEYYTRGFSDATETPPDEIPAEVKKRAKEAAKKLVGEDIYDLILDYLLDEGFASDLQSAQMIMSHMSIDWIDDIINENKATERFAPRGVSNARSATERKMGQIYLSSPDFAQSTGRSGSLTPSGQRRVTRQNFADRSKETTQGRTRPRTGETWYGPNQNN